MRIKAYCLYGGNTLYQCSYAKAADLLGRLAQTEGNPFDANALGILYYEGLPDGTPDYELAYQYFTIGAFNGIFESMCHCADMLIRGEGVPVNLRAAASLVHLAYSRTKEKFTDGALDASFAESAMRMGDCARYGIGEKSDGMLAMSYYLEAGLAIRIRMRLYTHFQDDILFRQIESRIEEAETALGNAVTRDQSILKEPIIVDRLLSCGHAIAMDVDHEEGDSMYTFIFHRCHPENGECLLLTVESMGVSELYDKVGVLAMQVSSSNLKNGDQLIIDRVGMDQNTGETIFYYHNQEAGRIRAESWMFKDEGCLQSRKEEDTLFTSVCFEDMRHTYDYICNIPGLKRGDRVLVNTSQGAAAATVVREFREKMSRMPLPKERYRRMIQKITPQLYS
jgi:hypothetical protein